MKRPHACGNYVSSKSSENNARILGVEFTSDGVALTKDEFKNLQKLYEFTETDKSQFHKAGSDRNLIRHAKCDGLRVIAFMSKFLEPGEDPVKVLARLASNYGFDVGCDDIDWAYDEQ